MSAYLDGIGLKLLAATPLFRTRKGTPYEKN